MQFVKNQWFSAGVTFFTFGRLMKLLETKILCIALTHTSQDSLRKFPQDKAN